MGWHSPGSLLLVEYLTPLGVHCLTRWFWYIEILFRIYTPLVHTYYLGWDWTQRIRNLESFVSLARHVGFYCYCGYFVWEPEFHLLGLDFRLFCDFPITISSLLCIAYHQYTNFLFVPSTLWSRLGYVVLYLQWL